MHRLKSDLLAQERVERQVVEQGQGGFQPAPAAPARTARGRDLADLQTSRRAAAVEGAAEAAATSPSPYQLSSMMRASVPPRRARWQGRRRWRSCRTPSARRRASAASGAERLDRASAAVVDVDDGDGRPRDADGKARDEQTYNSGADHDDAVGGSAARIPMRVEGSLHRGRERRAARRHGLGTGTSMSRGATKILVRVQAEHGAADQRRRPRHRARRAQRISPGMGNRPAEGARASAPTRFEGSIRCRRGAPCGVPAKSVRTRASPGPGEAGRRLAPIACGFTYQGGARRASCRPSGAPS